jgi:hypothetical protein
VQATEYDAGKFARGAMLSVRDLECPSNSVDAGTKNASTTNSCKVTGRSKACNTQQGIQRRQASCVQDSVPLKTNPAWVSRSQKTISVSCSWRPLFLTSAWQRRSRSMSEHESSCMVGQESPKYLLASTHACSSGKVPASPPMCRPGGPARAEQQGGRDRWPCS